MIGFSRRDKSRLYIWVLGLSDGHDIILFAVAPTTTLITLLRRKQFVLRAMAAPIPPVNALLATMYLQAFDTYAPQTTLL